MESEFISHAELSDALGCRVQAFTVAPLQSSPRGYMADIYRLSVEVDGDQRSLIMKVASSDPQRRAIAERFGSYLKEQRFYGELNHDLPFRVPACYFNASDRFLLLLEDLGDDGAIDTMQGASEAQAHDAIQTLAKIHGHFRQNSPVTKQSIKTGLIAARQDMQTRVLESLKSQRPGSPVGQQNPATQLAIHYASNSADYMHLFEEQEQVFTQLDFRLDNLRFLNELVVLDWGESTHAPVGFDLAGFLVTSLRIEDRQQWESDLLALYGDTIKSFGLSHNPKNTLASYQLALLPSLYLPGLIRTHGEVHEGQILLERNLSAIEDHLPDLASAATWPDLT